MKKLLFSAYSLDVGGIEKALVTLILELNKKGYDITLVLEKKEGIFLKELDKKIKILEFRPSENKNKILRKIKNFYNRIRFVVNHKNKYDFSASFATYSNAGAFVARCASKNCYLWGHADYFTLFSGDVSEMKSFFREKQYNKFKKIIFVSKEGKDSFINVFPEMKNKVVVCNNLIDGEKIIKLSKEQIEIKKENLPTFLNVGRHEERQKRLTRLIEAAKNLKEKGKKFKILFVGDGPDTEKYKKMVNEYKLEKQIIFVGRKQNPYPYFKISDCVVLTSEYEGYPVVFLESMLLKRPIITTKVSDYEEIEGKFGYTTTREIEDISKTMEKIIDEGYVLKEKFDYKKYNENIIEKIEEMF